MSAYEEQYITVSDDNGNETLYEVLFTFDSEDYGKSYILLIPAGSEPEIRLTFLPIPLIPKQKAKMLT